MPDDCDDLLDAGFAAATYIGKACHYQISTAQAIKLVQRFTRI